MQLKVQQIYDRKKQLMLKQTKGTTKQKIGNQNKRRIEGVEPDEKINK